MMSIMARARKSRCKCAHLVTKRATNERLGLGNVVSLSVWCAVTVRVGLEGITGVDEVWLGRSHQVLALNLGFLVVLVEGGSVASSEKHSTWRPGELVTERVVRVLGSGQTTTVGPETGDLAAGLVHLIDSLDSIQVVQTRIQANLVEDGDAGVLGGLIQLLHGWRDV